MKYIKTYELIRRGLFNKNLPIISFVIGMEDGNDCKLVLKEFEKYFKLNEYDYNKINKVILYVEIFETYEDGDLSRPRLTLKLNVPSTGNNIIYSKEFLEIGLENVKDYFELKNNTKKFNL